MDYANSEIELTIHSKIEDIVWDLDVSYLDACLIYCENNDIEEDSFMKMIKGDQKLLSLIYRDAEKLNLVEKVARFPDDTV